MLAAQALPTTLYFWSPWKALALSCVQLWAKHFA
jgi:hypothetical protein